MSTINTVVDNEYHQDNTDLEKQGRTGFPVRLKEKGKECRMSHDITHCKGVDGYRNVCPRRGTCRRYLAHIELRNCFIGGSFQYVRFRNIYDCKGLYWESGAVENQKNANGFGKGEDY